MIRPIPALWQLDRLIESHSFNPILQTQKSRCAYGLHHMVLDVNTTALLRASPHELEVNLTIGDYNDLISPLQAISAIIKQAFVNHVTSCGNSAYYIPNMEPGYIHCGLNNALGLINKGIDSIG